MEDEMNIEKDFPVVRFLEENLQNHSNLFLSIENRGLVYIKCELKEQAVFSYLIEVVSHQKSCIFCRGSTRFFRS